MFKTDGSVHHGGIKNENKTIDILNQIGIYNQLVEKRGGTTQKADAIAGDKKISIKRKEGIENGSFDWFNTSKYNDVLGNVFKPFLSNLKELRSISKDLIADDKFVLKVRDNFNKLCELSLNTLNSDQIIDILRLGLVNANIGFDIVVNDTKTDKLYIFGAENHPAVEYINQGFSAILEGKGKSSRKVLFSDGINLYDCGLRIRVTSNNGINAFLGLSKANKTSQVVIKLQQDKVKQLLISTNSQKYDY
jgi:hypothetical protein